MLVRYGNQAEYRLEIAWSLSFLFFYCNCYLPSKNVNKKRSVMFLKFVCFCVVRFGEESMSRVLRWMDKAKIPEDAAILDIGTGNGAFLVELV